MLWGHCIGSCGSEAIIELAVVEVCTMPHICLASLPQTYGSSSFCPTLIVVNDPTSDISSLKQSARILWGIKGIIKSSPLCQQGWLVAVGPPSLLKHSLLLPAQHHLHLIFSLLISTIMTDQRQNNEKIAAMTSQPLNRAVSDGYLTEMQTWTFSISSYSNK